MATRGIIARTTEGGFTGRYHHWDSYPGSLGQTLWSQLHGHFQGDLAAMLKYLLDDHPAGWSTINKADFTLTPGFDGPGPHCYCHGSRSEDEQVCTQSDDCGAEYAYVFDEAARQLTVYEATRPNGRRAIGLFGSIGGPGSFTWQPIWSGGLDLPGPDWGHLS